MKEQSTFYSSLGLLIILNVIVKPLWIFGIDRQVQNAVGTEAYGTYFSLFNFSIVFSFLLDWGLTAFFNRQLAAQKETVMNRAADFLLVKIIFLAIYISVIIGIALVTHIERWDILWGVIAVQALTSLFLFLRGIVTAHQWFHTGAWLSVLDKTLMIVLCGSLLFFPSVFGGMTISKFLWAQVVCTFLTALCVLVILFRRHVSFRLAGYSLHSLQFFKTALPFAIIVLLMSVHNRLDGFLLERIHPNGAYEAGVYAASYRLLDAASMIGYLPASFLLPYIARQWSQEKNISEVILTSRHLLVTVSIAIAVTAVFMAPWIQQLLYHQHNATAIAVLQWCLPALIGYSLVNLYGTLLTATGHINAFCIINFIAVAINIFLNLLLIPVSGAKGCCIAALVSQGFCGIATLLYTRKKLNIPIHPRSLLMYTFIGVLLATYFYVSNDIVPDKWLQVITAMFITLSAVFITKLFRIRTWMNLFKQPDQ